MKCRHHPDRQAEHFCATCNAPLCDDCAEELRPGVYACFQCAMLQSVSEVGTSIVERKEKAAEKENKKKKGWGPFQYFVIVCTVLILVMWGVIIFGGQSAPGQSTATIAKGQAGRVLLFLVNGSIKRFAHYEGNQYPETLAQLVPKYLQLKKSQVPFLNKLLYSRNPDPKIGYQLSLAHVSSGEMRVTLTAGGVQYSAPGGQGS